MLEGDKADILLGLPRITWMTVAIGAAGGVPDLQGIHQLARVFVEGAKAG